MTPPVRQAMRWRGDALLMLDQRRLPTEEVWLTLSTPAEIARAISDMVVRGAPAIGITAGYGMALAQRHGDDLEAARVELLAARPTAVNLRWAVERVAAADDMVAEAVAIHEEDIANNLRMGQHGAPLLASGVLTICNTGFLATGGHGTALGIVRSAFAGNPRLRLYALETRPILQGARLTAWECLQDGIPCTLITDGMAGALMASGRVGSVVVGCDRVAKNGDTANKIGTYQLAVLARYHGLPFYVAMPRSTLDAACLTGARIPIEERPPAEVRQLRGNPLAPPEVAVWNPAFDVTPSELITGWVTEDGLWTPRQ